MKNTEHKTLFASPLMASAAFFGLVWLAGTTQTVAQGTPQQQQACTPDAQRLCGAYIPDAARVGACLMHMRPQLSPACRAAISPPSTGHKRTHHHHS